jgi:hypothetical protein
LEVKYYNLEGGSCLGCDKTKGAIEVHMQGLLMWAIHDLLAYGLFSNQVTHGYKGCPMCGPNKMYFQITNIMCAIVRCYTLVCLLKP